MQGYENKHEDEQHGYTNIHQHICAGTPMPIPLRMRPMSVAIIKIKQIETY